MEKPNNPAPSLSTEELRKMLAEREAEEKAAKQAKRKEYESIRDQTVNSLVEDAKALSRQMADFKSRAFKMMDQSKELLKEYGGIRSNSKGGFGMRNAAGDKKAVLSRNVAHEYDERADEALTLIREFLEEKVKKKDAQTYRTVSTLLEKNTKGDLDPARVASLLKIRDNYTDEKWVKAMDLLVESYHPREVAYNVEFYEKDAQGKDQYICLSFAALTVTDTGKDEEEADKV